MSRKKEINDRYNKFVFNHSLISSLLINFFLFFSNFLINSIFGCPLPVSGDQKNHLPFSFSPHSFSPNSFPFYIRHSLFLTFLLSSFINFILFCIIFTFLFFSLFTKPLLLYLLDKKQKQKF